ncbi:hypothetical protein [Flavobacterium terrigena]|uniref:DinB family protein n=1 Tax=Flavobacterium terrigena TaxID=402734 RepID=A0A1H6WDV9_9FLAO|nr:hypothetical protein [Flavobacterium terrigena]SEJ11000.1 hypothetical protein SAMN05660918_2401 [Flavobacterium terrigena]
MNFTSVKQTLSELQHLLNQISEDDYSKPIEYLSNASIGEHTRHIIELFQCAINSYEVGELNYDNRGRNLLIQTSPSFAIEKIDEICNAIEKENKDLILESVFFEEVSHMKTNYFREIIYNLEHCIHHQALIKVAVFQFEYLTVNANFGVAPSTIVYRNKCAQ